MNAPRPDVKLVGEDGNAFFIIGKCVNALRRAGCTNEYIAEFKKEATSGSYDDLLYICMTYCTVY